MWHGGCIAVNGVLSGEGEVEANAGCGSLSSWHFVKKKLVVVGRRNRVA